MGRPTFKCIHTMNFQSIALSKNCTSLHKISLLQNCTFFVFFILSFCLFVFLSFCLFVFLSFCLFVHLDLLHVFPDVVILLHQVLVNSVLHLQTQSSCCKCGRLKFAQYILWQFVLKVAFWIFHLSQPKKQPMKTTTISTLLLFQQNLQVW